MLMLRLFSTLIIFIKITVCLSDTNENAPFDYDYESPSKIWVETCSKGNNQSPINFSNDFTTYNIDPKMTFVEAHYGINNKINATVIIEKTNKYIITNTDTTKSIGGYVLIKKDNILYRFDLTNIDFHVISEHTMGDIAGELEMNLNHVKNTTYLAENNILGADLDSNNLIISVIFKVASNSENTNIAKINLPNRGPVIDFDLSYYIPIGLPYFYYKGSLTYPPCTEKVDRVVLHKMEVISKLQFESFKDWIATTYLDRFNRRKTKEIKNRIIYYQYNPDQKPLIQTGSKILERIFLSIILIFIYL
jgi:carbonic anhydrase